MTLMETTLLNKLRIAGLASLFLAIIVFAIFRSYDLVVGVKIRNVNITDGAKMADNVMKVAGNAKNAVSLALNGREISIDQRGNFDETVVLLPGYNIVNIKAEDKFGDVDEKDYKLIFQP